MTDTAIKNAIMLRDRLDAELKDLERQIKAKRDERERTVAFISAWHAFADDDAKDRLKDSVQSGDVHDTAKSQKNKNPKKEYVAEQTARIIESVGRPMSRSELFKSLKDRGIHLHGKNPEMVLSTMLWRSTDTIVRLQPHGYWLADKPYPPAGYDPVELAKVKAEASRAPNDLF